ncbi:glycosyltransferase family 4 protein [Comamonas sp. 4034]|uniref:glycosyltransferase family 4 protein n=1 Tax=Comamonas sp. 4034 TaxID=3156455 RepID=UPI003D1D2A7E
MTPTAEKNNKSTICLVTPWPPQYSGIADYAYSLTAALIKHGLEVTIVTNCQNPTALAGCNILSINSDSELKNALDGHVMPIFQLGNHPDFHGFMLDAINWLGDNCLIELHDVVLHHLIIGATGNRNKDSFYLNWLERNYGSVISNQFESDKSFSLDETTSLDFLTYPCSDHIVDDCAGVIVHSHFAKSVLKNAGVTAPIWNINLYENNSAQFLNRIINDEEILKIGIFGGVQKNRKIESVIEALSSLSQKAIDRISLDIYGSIDSDCQYLIEKSNNNFGEKIKFHGRIEETEFHKAFLNTDLCISLRSPSMGETSAIVSRALSIGLPTIVSNTGWYAELPEFIPKVNNGKIESDLASLIEIISTNRALYAKFRNQFIDYARSLDGMDSLVDDLVSIRSGILERI